MGKRPDYAVTVYCNLIRQRYKKAPIIIGGIEASLRRLAHYDYWSDKLKRSVLLDAQADLLIYGMGERAIVEIADALNDGMDVHDITYIDGTVFKVKAPDENLSYLKLPSYPELQKSKRKYAESFYLQYQQHRPVFGQTALRALFRPRICRPESAAKAAFAAGDGRGLRSSLLPHVSPELRSARRRARDF